MREGVLIDYKLTIHGIPVRWQSEISTWDPPRRFIDVQRRGPYRVWIHEHTFAAKGQGTLVKDHVRYAAAGGALIQRFFILPDLKQIFDYRRRQLEMIFRNTPNEVL